MNEEFYVGYAPEMPARLKRRVVKIVVALNAVAAVVAVTLVFGQQPFSAAVFEYGTVRDFQGVVREHPYASLLVARPGALESSLPFSRYLLTAPGKHGASSLVSGMDGTKVRLRGSLVFRDGDTMIEVAPGIVPSKEGKPVAMRDTAWELGVMTLAGEIVDSKCYLGVMNPGFGKVHRDCAVRCISGGIPPAFRVRDSEGGARILLLAGADGRPLNREVLEYVAEPIAIRGRVKQSGETYILWADPSSFVRLE